MSKIREIAAHETKLAASALLELRPRWATVDALADFVDTSLRPLGYRIVGAFADDVDSAVAVLGFREGWSTAWGHHLYIDDLATVAHQRGRGYGEALMDWVDAQARVLDCEAIHLDSGVGTERAAAHRLYMRHHFQIAAHHFAATLE
ncbi:GNAT family N-acetyltransferase [Nocardia bovistercoris]|uniref:GNAT family N-acetyltransferase n=1 Tax=Nocardia bovistercoris TaxID=2785916 RepID=A0A931ICB5_9NOCA|nr:GNAT family N-acetyltransferase [Nocardia bovistercoris]MBH0777810.1 GNAT family N-acetyltransferase [Nocardia bovistercoris]